MKPLITSQDFPPNYEEIKKHFELTGDEIFAYGETLYNPNKKILTPDLINHEMLHIQQQAGKTEEWWDLYLKDKEFRCSQEIPAHQVQYFTAKKYIRDRNKLFNYLKQLAINLSGKTYGQMMTFNEAVEQIKKEKLFNLKGLLKK